MLTYSSVTDYLLVLMISLMIQWKDTFAILALLTIMLMDYEMKSKNL